LWKEFMIDEGLEIMNIGFLRGHVDKLTQSIIQPFLPLSQASAKSWWRFRK
jgi:hypothetical protein